MDSTRKFRFVEKFCLTALLIAIVCTVIAIILGYRYGYCGSPRSLVFFWITLRFIRILVILALVVGFATSLIRKQGRFVSFISIAIFLALSLTTNRFATMEGLILRGMRSRLLMEYRVDEFRRFAREFDQLPYVPNSGVPGSGKTYTNQDMARAGLLTKYPFISYLGSVTVIQRGSTVEIMAGRPLKILCVSTDGTRVSEDYFGCDVFKVSPDVILAVRSQ